MEVLQSHYSLLPEDPGVYIFLDDNRNVLYVGKAKNLKKRVSSYFLKKDHDPKTSILVTKVNKIKVIIVNSELESLILEANLIKKYLPKYNLRLTDGKSYIQIKITIKDKNPKILMVRKEDDNKSLYFGPYPSSNDVKLVLRLIRKIFPFQNVNNHSKKYCLYNHLGLCPCPPMFVTDEERQKYINDIKRIIKFLDGKSQLLIKDLEKEREDLSKLEEFEEAKKIQDKIDSINNIIQNFHSPIEFEKNPKLVKELVAKEILQLKSVLTQNNVNVKNLKRIECYDISNISGINATGSMVVFTNGFKNKKEYKRFKIKNPPKVVPNDYVMMQEVVSRRLNHKEWDQPSLIIVDGGKGQVSSVIKILKDRGFDIPLIGLAKKQETIITSRLDEVRLSKNSPAILLVRRIRDEAHRFAITYHKKLRSKFIYE